ncbi:isoprenylcysteine carboxyl methyltransferase (icmt) family protein [Besnoitia besnoiti]|uniref:Protein-S-isoprenylcysteine O-methyltransferase n=1 Tax=Besnoitia besnoiti TaxID=94643 RepID=A0A2A9M3J0_BESBE|nr:isoprenylcysteine carboxyl methyltransferase (icmt) family protein [Besnoitia besnoiti]PFH32525.1 isoprenylcysteine carboxyl methyltransferase (icmt) family protein [Besnoitia besnoiti]
MASPSSSSHGSSRPQRSSGASFSSTEPFRVFSSLGAQSASLLSSLGFSPASCLSAFPLFCFVFGCLLGLCFAAATGSGLVWGPLIPLQSAALPPNSPFSSRAAAEPSPIAPHVLPWTTTLHTLAVSQHSRLYPPASARPSEEDGLAAETGGEKDSPRDREPRDRASRPADAENEDESPAGLREQKAFAQPKVDAKLCGAPTYAQPAFEAASDSSPLLRRPSPPAASGAPWGQLESLSAFSSATAANLSWLCLLLAALLPKLPQSSAPEFAIASRPRHSVFSPASSCQSWSPAGPRASVPAPAPRQTPKNAPLSSACSAAATPARESAPSASLQGADAPQQEPERDSGAAATAFQMGGGRALDEGTAKEEGRSAEWAQENTRDCVRRVVRFGGRTVFTVPEVYVQGVLLVALSCIFGFFGARSFFGCDPLWMQLEGLYLFLVASHHITEFFFVFFYHRRDLSSDCFLLNNTAAYSVALFLSVAELRLRPHLLRSLWAPKGDAAAEAAAWLAASEETPINLLRGLLAFGSRVCRGASSAFLRGMGLANKTLFSAAAGSSSRTSSGPFSLPSASSSPLDVPALPSPSLSVASTSAGIARGACLRDTVRLFTGASAPECSFMFALLSVFCVTGLLLAVGGLLLRLAAFVTAGRNFTHQIARTRLPSHSLVTRGVYGLYRHPAYTGWFYWAVGSQMALGNVLCMLLFAASSFAFFFERILYEEQLLEGMFPGGYCAYREATPSLGIPFLRAAVKHAQSGKETSQAADAKKAH